MSELYKTRPPKQEAPTKPQFTGTCCVMGCTLPGALSRNTRGGGPWYCREHFWNEGYPEAGIPKNPTREVPPLGEYLTRLSKQAT